MELSNKDYLNNKILPEIEIEGTTFIFDIDSIALFEKQNPDNYIEFDMMFDHGTHYGFSYSPVTKNIRQLGISIEPESPWSSDLFGNDPSEVSSNLRYVEIPKIGEIDPYGMCIKYGCSLEEISEKSDFEIMVDQTVYNERMAGNPVTLDFPGKSYEVDVAHNLLRPADGMGDLIDLNAMRYDYYLEYDEVYHLFYNTKECRVLDILKDDSDNSTLDQVILEIPQLSELDPIGANIALHRNPKQSLMYCDLKINHEAKIVPCIEYGANQRIDNILEKNELNISKQNITDYMERKLPEFIIEGTSFIVDVDKMELREKNDPKNTIPVHDMSDQGNNEGYTFQYSKAEKNMPSLFGSDDCISVRLPELVKLDPEGMSKKYGVPLDALSTKSDFEIMVDQTAYNDRLKGRLPTVDILGHIFYVDLRMDMLRPKYDFLSKGIEFSKIQDYYIEEMEKYWIPYDPKTHEYHQLNFDSITEIPKDVKMISFPHESDLDRIGFNRLHGLEVTTGLKEKNLQSHIKANVVPWKETEIEELIKENKSKTTQQMKIIQQPSKSKGRKL